MINIEIVFKRSTRSNSYYGERVQRQLVSEKQEFGDDTMIVMRIAFNV